VRWMDDVWLDREANAGTQRRAKEGGMGELWISSVALSLKELGCQSINQMYHQGYFSVQREKHSWLIDEESKKKTKFGMECGCRTYTFL